MSTPPSPTHDALSLSPSRPPPDPARRNFTHDFDHAPRVSSSSKPVVSHKVSVPDSPSISPSRPPHDPDHNIMHGPGGRSDFGEEEGMTRNYTYSYGGSYGGKEDMGLHKDNFENIKAVKADVLHAKQEDKEHAYEDEKVEGEKDSQGNVMKPLGEERCKCGGDIVWAVKGDYLLICDRCGTPQ